MFGGILVVIKLKVEIDTVLGTTMNLEEFYRYLIKKDRALSSILLDRDACEFIGEVVVEAKANPNRDITELAYTVQRRREDRLTTRRQNDHAFDAFRYAQYGLKLKDNPAIKIDPNV